MADQLFGGPPDSTPTLDRPAIAGIVSLAAVVAFVAVTLTFRRTYVLGFLVAWLAIGLFVGLRSRSVDAAWRVSRAKPKTGEFALAGVDTLGPMITLALVTLGVYYGIYWFARGVDATSDLVVGARAWAFWGSMGVISILAPLAVAGVVVSVTRKLYPMTAGIPSGYFELVTYRRQQVVVAVVADAAAVGALLVVGQVSSWPPAVSTVLVFLIVLVVSQAVAPSRSEPVQDRPAASILSALSSTLEASAYRVLLAPRTGRADVDPLLLDLDVLAVAEAGKQAFAMDVKQRSNGSAIGLSAGTALAAAARAVARVTLNPEVRVDPVLVLVGGRPEAALREFALAEHVSLVRIDPGEGVREVEGDRAEDLRDLVEAMYRALGGVR